MVKERSEVYKWSRRMIVMAMTVVALSYLEANVKPNLSHAASPAGQVVLPRPFDFYPLIPGAVAILTVEPSSPLLQQSGFDVRVTVDGYLPNGIIQFIGGGPMDKSGNGPNSSNNQRYAEMIIAEANAEVLVFKHRYDWRVAQAETDPQKRAQLERMVVQSVLTEIEPPFGTLPIGTLNYLDADLKQAVCAIIKGKVAPGH